MRKSIQLIQTPCTASWTTPRIHQLQQPGKLNTPRSSHASIVFEGRIWVAGGFHNNYYALSSVEVYNAATKKWEVAPNMVKKRSYFNLLEVEGELYAVGGAYPDIAKAVFRSKSLTGRRAWAWACGE